MSVECQVNVKSQSELDIGGRETCQLSSPRRSKDQVAPDFMLAACLLLRKN